MMPHPLTTFIYKVASRCNLDCTYCYEYNMGDNSWRLQPHFTSLKTVKQLGERVKEHALVHHLDYVMFSFHGGEPLLAGAAFFRNAVTMLRDILSPEVSCNFGIQTNGTLITEEVVQIFSEYDISIGLSVDGPQAVNDKFRVYANGQGSFENIMKGVRHLQTPAGHQIFRGGLCVINVNADPLEVFDFIASLGAPSIDFLLPHANWLTIPPGKNADDLQATIYADWLITIFDEWFSGRHQDIRIRTFEEIIEHELGGKGHLETLGLEPVSLICIAADGSIEGVDTLKSVSPGAQRTGLNIFDHSFDEALQHVLVQERQMGLEALSDQCLACPLVQTCGGGYYPHRWSQATGFKNPSVYCADLTKLINHIRSTVRETSRRDASLCRDIR